MERGENQSLNLCKWWSARTRKTKTKKRLKGYSLWGEREAITEISGNDHWEQDLSNGS